MSELALLLGLKARLALNAARAIRREPPLKTAVVALSVALWAACGFALMWRGVRFMAGFPGVGGYLTGRLFSLFVLALSVMLAASNVVLAYPVLYARRENSLLLSLPLSPRAIVSCKLWETMFLSSWAFMVMAMPLALAYFLASGMGLALFFASWLFFIPLVALCAGCGVLAALLWGRWMPRLGLRAKRWAAVACCAGAAGVFMARGGRPSPQGDPSLRFVNQIVSKCAVAEWWLLPSRWASAGISAGGSGRLREAAFFWLVLMSNAVFLFSLCASLGSRFLAAGWSRRASRAAPRAAPRRIFLLGRGSPMRNLVAKDIISFCRDVGQWSQFAIFFGLLAVYIMNIRNLPYDLGVPFWRYLLFILNLSALGCTLAGLSSRFFFPMVSLELQRFWILGCAPLGVRGMLREKYLLCAAFTAGVTGALALISGVMLRVTPVLLASSFVTVAFMGIAMAGLSVGLGAAYPNLRAVSSAEIVSGLGGTMVLVLNMGYLCGALLLQGIPLYLHMKGIVAGASFVACVFGGVCLTAAFSARIARIALEAGRRRLEGMDL